MMQIACREWGRQPLPKKIDIGILLYKYAIHAIVNYNTILT